jgi:hypothetical protein
VTRQVDMQQDFFGSGTLTSSEWCHCKQILRVDGWHRTILCDALRWTQRFRRSPFWPVLGVTIAGDRSCGAWRHDAEDKECVPSES